jgi:hypothetical protein
MELTYSSPVFPSNITADIGTVPTLAVLETENAYALKG